MLEEGSNCLFLLVCCPDRVPRCLGWLRAAAQDRVKRRSKILQDWWDMQCKVQRARTVGNVCDRRKLIALKDLQGAFGTGLANAAKLAP